MFRGWAGFPAGRIGVVGSNTGIEKRGLARGESNGFVSRPCGSSFHMNPPIPFEEEFPFEAETLQYVYAMQTSRYFGARWLHIFSHGGWNNIPWGRYTAKPD